MTLRLAGGSSQSNPVARHQSGRWLFPGEEARSEETGEELRE